MIDTTGCGGNQKFMLIPAQPFPAPPIVGATISITSWNNAAAILPTTAQSTFVQLSSASTTTPASTVAFEGSSFVYPVS